MCDSIIYLIGFSGTGKTTIGKELSKILDIPFLDMDSKIEKLQNESITSIFKNLGEDKFRKMETDLIRSVALASNQDCRYSQVVSTGGGVWSNPENREIMSDSGIVVCLNASPETILMRLEEQQANEGSVADRPMLNSEQNSLETIKKLLEVRYKDYIKADFIVNTDYRNTLDIAMEIVDLFK